MVASAADLTPGQFITIIFPDGAHLARVAGAETEGLTAAGEHALRQAQPEKPMRSPEPTEGPQGSLL
jgi:hypothetical protein